MKKIIFCLMAVILSLTLLPVKSFGSTTEEPSSLPVTKPVESSEVKTLELRLNELNSMDKSNMKSAEKKNMRKEVRTIKRELRTISGGVYISAGLLIVILIVLIVIL